MKIRKILLTLVLLTPLFLPACKGNTWSSETPISSEESSEQPVEPTILKIPSVRIIDANYDTPTEVPFNGREHQITVDDFDDKNSTITTDSIYSAVNAGTYHVHISLNDPAHFCWEDGTHKDRDLTWTIKKAGEADIFDYFLYFQDRNIHYMDTIALPPTEQPMPMRFFVKFVPEDPYLEIPTADFQFRIDSKTYSDTIIQNGYIIVKHYNETLNFNVNLISNDVELCDQAFSLMFQPPEKEIIELNQQTYNTLENYGLSYRLVADYGKFDHGDDYFFIFNSESGGCRIDTKMTMIKKVTVKFNSVGILSSLLACASLDESNYTECPGDIDVEKPVSKLTDDQELIFEFNESDFDTSKGYYHLKFWWWLSGEPDDITRPYIQSIKIEFISCAVS